MEDLALDLCLSRGSHSETAISLWIAKLNQPNEMSRSNYFCLHAVQSLIQDDWYTTYLGLAGRARAANPAPSNYLGS